MMVSMPTEHLRKKLIIRGQTVKNKKQAEKRMSGEQIKL